LTFGQQSLDSSSLFVLGEIVAPGVVNNNVWHLTDVCESASQVVNDDDSFVEGWSWQAARNNPVWSPRKPRAPPKDHEGWTSDTVLPLVE
jgi:hypothetical protein